ncbi:MAG: zinc-dependent metalloprotease, partial [Gemmataceae bacterium]
LAPKGVKQGDYFSTTLGPYDYWAIEYGYKPLAGSTDSEVKDLVKIASKGALPGHHYGTDEDLYSTDDPLINVWDLGDDPMRFSKERIAIAQEMLKDLSERVVDKGEGYQRVRLSFVRLLGQYGNGAYLVANHVGGQYVNRDHHGDEKGRDPIVPVAPAKQREALKFLEENILTDKPFQFSPQLLRRLAADRWLHWGNEYAMFAGVEFPLHERILSIQGVALNHLFDPSTLKRIQNNTLKAEENEKPLELHEVFRSVTNAVWSDLPVKPDAKQPVVSSVIRRNLQREHVKKLSGLVLGASPTNGGFVSSRLQAPPDARSLARLHLNEISKRIDAALKGKQKLDDTVRAHLEETQLRIDKVLSASVQVREP